MRKIMAGIETAVEDFVQVPDCDGKCVKIPEPDSGNGSRCGVVPAGARVRSRQSMDVLVTKSGPFPGFREEQGALVKVRPDWLLDDDDGEVCDSYNWMGGERPVIPGYTQQLNNALDQDENEYRSPRILELKHWKDYSTAYGVRAIAGVAYSSGTHSYIRFYRMDEYQDHGGMAGGEVDYEWDYNAGMTLTTDATSPAKKPTFDVVEMSDGSLVVAVANGDGQIEIYRSFDLGQEWLDLADAVTGLSQNTFVALNRVGNRLVLAYAYTNAITNTIYTRYSDDGGFTWSTATTVKSAAGNSTMPLELVMGKDGVLYLFVSNGGGNADVYYTTNGIDWDSSGNDTGCTTDNGTNASFYQAHTGRWEAYYLDDSSGLGYYTVVHAYSEGDDSPDYAFDGTGSPQNYRLLKGAGDTAGMNANWICARPLLDGAFVEVFTVWHDNDSGTSYYSLTMVRARMWSGFQLLNSGLKEFQWVWVPNAYPDDTTDPHPNLNQWSLTRAAAGASAAGSDGNFGHIELTADLSGLDSNVYYLSGAGTIGDDLYDEGTVAKIELKVVGGHSKLIYRLCSNGTNKDEQFHIIFGDDNKITLYDLLAGAAAIEVEPTNWATTDWNAYLVVTYRNVVELYRAPAGKYREFEHWELVFDETVTTQAYAGDNDQFGWGLFDTAAVAEYNDDSEMHVRSVMFNNTADDYNWNFETDGVGRRLHTDPVGVMQGFGIMGAGEWALEDDQWDVITGGHYRGENILVDSPSRYWLEPNQGGDYGGAGAVYSKREWILQRDDADDQEMQYTFNAIAMFNFNSPFFKLYGENFGGGGTTTLLDTSGVTQLGPRLHTLTMDVDAIEHNVVQLGQDTSNIDTDFVPGQYASNDWRNWYLLSFGGDSLGNVYRILNNDEDTVYLDRDAETDGLSVGNNVILFADRFFHIFDQTYTYPRVVLELPQTTGVYPDGRRRLGTVVLGRTFDLDDDEWDCKVTGEPNLRVAKTRSGADYVHEIGPERRAIDLSYSGQTDRGMGVEKAREFFRHVRWGVRPIVWVDHDDIYGMTYYSPAHTEPILARMLAPYAQSRDGYRQLTQNGVDHIRNLLTSGVRFEEVL